MQDIDQWKQKGEVRKKVREVGETSEVAGSSDQCQGPWEIKQNKKWEKTSRFVWKDTTGDFPVVILPCATVDAGYQIPPPIEEVSGEKMNIDHSSHELEREGSNRK